jgi:septum formation protein
MTCENRRIVLASKSPRRIYLLKELGFLLTIDPSGVDEDDIPYTNQREFALKAALAKAEEVSARHPDDIIVAADTIVCVDHHILGKPRDAGEARDMLQTLRNRSHTVITGVAVLRKQPRAIYLDAEETEVFFKRFTKKTLENYLATGDSMDKAGAYGIQGEGECLIHHIDGDYFNVMGLPLVCLLRLLSQFMEVEPYISRMECLRRPF